MTKDNIKKKLKIYIESERKLIQIKERHAELKEKLINPQAQVLTDMPRSEGCNKDKIINGISVLEELDVKMMEMQKRFIRNIYEVEEMLEVLSLDEKSVIELRYMENKSWVEIGQNLNMSERTAQRVHGYALQKMLA